MRLSIGGRTLYACLYLFVDFILRARGKILLAGAYGFRNGHARGKNFMHQPVIFYLLLFCSLKLILVPLAMKFKECDDQNFSSDSLDISYIKRLSRAPCH